MADNIIEMFYTLGGYKSRSDANVELAYVPLERVKGTYIPLGCQLFNAMCSPVKTASINTLSWSSGDILDDRIISEFSLYFADSSYDTIRVDPDTYMVENRHFKEGERLLLTRYGVRDKRSGDLIAPSFMDGGKALVAFGIAKVGEG